MNLQDLKKKTPPELLAFAEEQGVEGAAMMRRQELMFAILQKLGADQEIDAHVLIRGHPLLEIAAPTLPRVVPRLDRVTEDAEPVHGERGTPPIVAERLHRQVAPAPVTFMLEEKAGGQRFVSMRVYVRLDHDRLAHHPFDREPSAVDLWLHTFDNDAAAERLLRMNL